MKESNELYLQFLKETVDDPRTDRSFEEERLDRESARLFEEWERHSALADFISGLLYSNGEEGDEADSEIH